MRETCKRKMNRAPFCASFPRPFSAFQKFFGTEHNHLPVALPMGQEK